MREIVLVENVGLQARAVADALRASTENLKSTNKILAYSFRSNMEHLLFKEVLKQLQTSLPNLILYLIGLNSLFSNIHTCNVISTQHKPLARKQCRWFAPISSRDISRENVTSPFRPTLPLSKCVCVCVCVCVCARARARVRMCA